MKKIVLTLACVAGIAGLMASLETKASAEPSQLPVQNTMQTSEKAADCAPPKCLCNDPLECVPCNFCM